MTSLFLDSTELKALDTALTGMEDEFGAEYLFSPDYSEFSCKCSGPGQSCVWH